MLALHDHGGFKYLGWRKIVRSQLSPLHPMVERHQRVYYGGVGWPGSSSPGAGTPSCATTCSRSAAGASGPRTSRTSWWSGSCRPPGQSARARARRGRDSPVAERRCEVPPGEPSDRIERYHGFAAQHESIVAKSLFSAGLTWPGMTLAEDRAALSYLASRPDVDARAARLLRPLGRRPAHLLPRRHGRPGARGGHRRLPHHVARLPPRHEPHPHLDDLPAGPGARPGFPRDPRPAGAAAVARARRDRRPAVHARGDGARRAGSSRRSTGRPVRPMPSGSRGTPGRTSSIGPCRPRPSTGSEHGSRDRRQILNVPMALARPFATWLGHIAGPLSPARLAGLRWLFIDALFSQAAVQLLRRLRPPVRARPRCHTRPHRPPGRRGEPVRHDGIPPRRGRGGQAQDPQAVHPRHQRGRRPARDPRAGVHPARRPAAAVDASRWSSSLRCVTVFMSSAGTPAVTIRRGGPRPGARAGPVLRGTERGNGRRGARGRPGSPASSRRV